MAAFVHVVVPAKFWLHLLPSTYSWGCLLVENGDPAFVRSIALHHLSFLQKWKGMDESRFLQLQLSAWGPSCGLVNHLITSPFFLRWNCGASCLEGSNSKFATLSGKVFLQSKQRIQMQLLKWGTADVLHFSLCNRIKYLDWSISVLKPLVFGVPDAENPMRIFAQLRYGWTTDPHEMYCIPNYASKRSWSI